MIGRLCGKVLERTPPWLLLDVSGVGYEVEAPMSTFYKLPLDKDAEVILFTHMVVRDDAHLLFGFSSQEERLFFRSLIKVNGVGAKMALAILSGMEMDEFSQCISAEDTSTLTRLPGVGKKTAERLIVEMKDKLPDSLKSTAEALPTKVKTQSATSSSSTSSQASAALISLGYKPAEALKMVAAVRQKNLSTEEIIRQALKSRVNS